MLEGKSYSDEEAVALRNKFKEAADPCRNLGEIISLD